MTQAKVANIRPRHDHVLIKAKHLTEYKAGNLIIPNVSTETPGEATIVAIGPNTNLKVGDTILFRKGVGIEIMEDQETYIFLRDLSDTIYCVIEEDVEATAPVLVQS